MKEYVILKHISIPWLEAQVQIFVDRDYIPQWGVGYWEWFFFQALVLKK